MAYTKKTWSATIKDLTLCFEQWGVMPKQWTVDTVLTPAKAANERQTLAERTVRIWWTRRGRDHELAISKWPRAVDNLRALYNIIDDLRLAEHRGFEEQARQYYAQLAAPIETHTGSIVAYVLSPRSVLGVPPDASLETAEAAYKQLARKYHPDNRETGDLRKFIEAGKALETIRQEAR